MAGLISAIWQLRDALKSKAKTEPKKSAATVSRVEPDGTVWVRLAGGDDETPVTKPTTAEVVAGDAVTVEIGGGASRIVGNSTTPAVGVSQVTNIVSPVASIASQAITDAQTAATAAESAQESALIAKDAADSATANLKSVVSGAQTVEKAVSVMQTALEAVVDYDPDTDTTTEYFWHDANGAHVLGDESGYRNDITSTGMSIVDVGTETSIASFGASNAQIGKSSGSHISIGANALNFYRSDGITSMLSMGISDSYSSLSTQDVEATHAVRTPTIAGVTRISINEDYDSGWFLYFTLDVLDGVKMTYENEDTGVTTTNFAIDAYGNVECGTVNGVDVTDALTPASLVVEQKTSSTYTIPANTVLSSMPTVNVSKSGYTPLGIVGANSSNVNVNVLRANISGTTAYMKLHNPTSASIQTTVTLFVLYVKSS